jgi:hypothetical protein
MGYDNRRKLCGCGATIRYHSKMCRKCHYATRSNPRPSRRGGRLISKVFIKNCTICGGWMVAKRSTRRFCDQCRQKKIMEYNRVKLREHRNKRRAKKREDSAFRRTELDRDNASKRKRYNTDPEYRAKVLAASSISQGFQRAMR